MDNWFENQLRMLALGIALGFLMRLFVEKQESQMRTVRETLWDVDGRVRKMEREHDNPPPVEL